MRYANLVAASCLLIFVALSPQLLQAQPEKLPKWEARLGLGLLPTFVKDKVKSIQPPLSVELRYRPLENLSIGLLRGQSISRGLLEHHSGARRLVTNRFQTTALRIAAHSNPWERWEVYGGLVLAYNKSDIEYTEPFQSQEKEAYLHTAPVRNGFTYTAFLGTSVKMGARLAAFGELGFGLSIATVGVAYRF